MFRLIIFEGVDKIGKSETVVELAKELRKYTKVITPHNDEQEYYIMFDRYHDHIKNIPFCIDKLYFGLMEYYQGFMMVKNVNDDVTILMDRLHLSELAYADIKRKRKLIELFGSKANLLSFFESFETSLMNLFDDVRLICYVANENTVFKDDMKNDSLKYTKEQLKKINRRYKEAYDRSILPKTLIKVSQDENGYFNTKESTRRILNMSSVYTYILNNIER